MRCVTAVGAFGNYMSVSIVNDGPVTITVESPKPQMNAQLKKSGNEPERGQEMERAD